MRKTTRNFLILLNPRERWQVGGLLAAVILMGLLQVVSIGSILPFLNVLVNPEAVSENRLLSGLFNFIGFEDQQDSLFVLGFIVLAMIVLSNGTKIATLWAIHRFSWNKHHRLSTYLLEQYLAQPYESFLDRNSAELGRNILVEVRNVTQGVLIPSMRLFASITTAGAVLIFLMWVNPVIALLSALTFGGLYGVIYLTVRQRLDRIGRIRMQANMLRFKGVNEAFGGIKDIKLMGRESSFVSQYVGPSRRFSTVNATREIITIIPRHALEAVAFGGLLLVIMVMMATQDDISNIIPIAGVFAFGAYRLLPALQEAFRDLTSLRFHRSVLEVLLKDVAGGKTPRAATVATSAVDAERLQFQKEIQLQGVTFTYPGAEQPAVREITLTVPRNSSVAIVGATGVGKTTLLDIFLGLLRPQQGYLAIDGTVVDDDNLRSWQNLLGYVPQHIFLCDDTLARNIAFGVPPNQIDHTAVERAAQIANLHDFIVGELPQGYDTLVGERGVRLSGGQLQRVGIARALYYDPEILVLDEATNALDGATEDAVQQAISQAAVAKTLVVVAHRLSTVRNSDVVYLMDHGGIVAHGSYQELLDSNPNFQAMVRAIA